MQDEAEDSSDEEWVWHERALRANYAQFGGPNGLPPDDPEPEPIALNTQIEMTELVASAFRRSDDTLILKRNDAGEHLPMPSNLWSRTIFQGRLRMRMLNYPLTRRR